MRVKRHDGTLKDAAEDVNYEIRMLVEAALGLGGWWSSPRTSLVDTRKNMALECFLLHYRNLRAFLCPSLQAPARNDDIVGSDYLDKATAEDMADAAALGDDKERLDKMLAHLSYSRRKEYIAKGNAVWPVGKMATAMLREIRGFLTKVPERMRPWFEEAAFLIDRDAPTIESLAAVTTLALSHPSVDKSHE